MPKITIKSPSGDHKLYEGKGLKIWRDGNIIEIYYNKSLDGGADYRKVVKAYICLSPDTIVNVEEDYPQKQTREVDPYTAKDLEERPDTKEEKDLLDAYKAIEPVKRKRGRPRKTKEGENNV